MKIKLFAEPKFDYNNGQIVICNDGLDLNCYGGGGKGAAPAPQPMVQPTPPVQEASVEIGADNFDAEQKKKAQSGKGSLKLPLTPVEDTGLKV